MQKHTKASKIYILIHRIYIQAYAVIQNKRRIQMRTEIITKTKNTRAKTLLTYTQILQTGDKEEAFLQASHCLQLFPWT